MKIALVWPYGFDTQEVLPLSLAYLKSNVDNNKHEVNIIDCSLLKINSKSPKFKSIISRFNPDLIGVTSWAFNYKEGLNVLKVAKNVNQSVITVIGGAYATCYPYEIIKEDYVDFIFRGESELTFPLFLDEPQKDSPSFSNINGLVYKSKDGQIFYNERKLEKNLDRIQLPDYDSINLLKYIDQGYICETTHKMNAPIWVTRGCPFSCAFCCASLINGKSIRAHSINYIIKWIKYLYYEKGIRMINIMDDNLTLNGKYTKELCEAIIKLNLKNLAFGTPNGIRVQNADFELFKLMKRAGWNILTVAPESGSVKVLKKMRKDLDPKIIPKKIREIKKAGLKVNGFFIMGYPDETVEDIKETVRLLRKCRFNYFVLNNFQPFPGTPIFEELVKNGQISKSIETKGFHRGRVYTPPALKNFNFSAFIIREYLYLLISQPFNIPFVFKSFGFNRTIKALLYHIYNTIKNSRVRKFKSVKMSGLA